MNAETNLILNCPLCDIGASPALRIPKNRGKLKVKCSVGHRFLYEPETNIWSNIESPPDTEPKPWDFSKSFHFEQSKPSAPDQKAPAKGTGLLPFFFNACGLLLFVGVPLWLFGFFLDGAGLLWPVVKIGGGIFAAWLALTLLLEWMKANEQPQTQQRSQRNAGAYGEAGFAYPLEVQQKGLLPESMPERRGVYLQRLVDAYTLNPDEVLTNWPIVYSGENALLTIAPAGSGKNAAAVMPSLMLCNDSAFVLDLKGENWWTTRHTRQNALGHRVVTLNPFNLWGEELGFDLKRPITHCFNPLERLNPAAPSFIAEIDSLAEALIIMHGGENGHFETRARDLLACVMAHVCSDRTEIKAGNKNLLRVRDVVAMDKARFIAWMTEAAKSPVARVRNVAASFLDVKSREVDGVLSTVNTQTGWLDNEAVRYFLRRSDLDFADMKKQPVTVYLMIAPELLKTYSPLVRLIIQGFFNAMKAKTATAGDRQVLAVLDEVNQLGRMESIEKAPSIMRGYGVRVWNIFQDCNQMKQTYADAWQSFESNADIIQIFTPNDYFTAEHFSKRIGNHTVTVQGSSQSQSWNQNDRGEGQGASQGTSYSSHGVPFMSPSDLMGFPKERGLVFYRTLKFPVLTSLINYYDDQEKLFSWGLDYLPFPHKSGHKHPNYPADIMKSERERIAQWRQHWEQGGTDGQYWTGQPIP
jgi:type IV secretion system protein VirD4